MFMPEIKTIVMKFGGTSVAEEAARKRMVKHIIREVNDGYKVLVVVSAMGRLGAAYSTDTLAQLVSKKVTPRESDRLLSCGEVISSIITSDTLRGQGVKVDSLAPHELGIITDDTFCDAHILIVDTQDLLKKFQKFDVLIAPGFIGINEEGYITTLGRGGSDTTAIALGASIGSEFIDIYSDVIGVMTKDPKIDPDAQLIKELTYDELIEIANSGAKVIHLKAIKLAKDYEVNMRFRSTFEDFVGTVVKKNVTKETDHE